MMSVTRCTWAAALISLVVLPSAQGAQPSEAVKLSHRDRLYDVTLAFGSAFVVGHPGLILRSDDGGKTFQNVAAGQTDEALFSIAFNSKGQGAIVGRSGFFLTSEDKGARWQKGVVKLGDEQPSLFGVDVLEDGTIVAVGEFGAIARSEDRGKSWSRSSFSIELPPQPEGAPLPEGCAAEEENENADMLPEARLTDVQFQDDQRGFVSGEFGLVLSTEDGGRSFTRLLTCTSNTLYGLSVPAPQQVLAVGADGLVVESEDGGKSFHALQSGTREHLFGVHADAQRTVVVGAAGALLTRNGAGPLRAVDTGVHSWLVSAALDAKGQGLIVGGRAHVLTTADGGNTHERVLGE